MAIKELKPDLLYVMQRAGVDISRAGNRRCLTVRCPFHEDRGRPNLAVWPETGRWRCFRCDAGGDVFDFVGMLIYGHGWHARDKEMFKEVLRRLNLETIPRQNVLPAPLPKPLDARRVQVLELASRVYHLALMGETGKEIRAGLAQRGIDTAALRRCRIGYAVPGALTVVLAGFPRELQTLAEAAGLFHDGREWLAGRIVFPDLNRNGAVLHMIGRALKRDAALRYLSLPGLPKTIWGANNLRRGQPVILTESIIDAVNLRQMGFQGTAVSGTGLASHLAEQLNRIPDLAILPQNDAPGREAVARWAALLPKARILEEIDWGRKEDGTPNKDLNDILVSQGKQAAFHLIQAALERVGLVFQRAS
jgi:DNA primase